MPATSARLLTHVRYLSEAIGPRPAGSPAHQAAANYIAAGFAAAGLAVERQSYSCPAWSHYGTDLSLNGVPVRAFADPFSPPCDLRAPAVAVGSMSELEAADLAGRIVVLHGELAKPGRRADGSDVHLLAVLAAARPAALLTVQPAGAEPSHPPGALELAVPSASVFWPAGPALALGPGAMARLRIASTHSRSQSTDLIARIGEGPPQLLLCAHYDTGADSPGAVHNASGVAVLIELARALVARQPALAVELVAFGGGHERSGADAGPLIAALRFDGIGQAQSRPSITAEAAPPYLEELLRSAGGPSTLWRASAPGEPAALPLRGVPAFVLGSQGGPAIAHTRHDIADAIDPGQLGAAFALGLAFVRQLEAHLGCGPAVAGIAA